MNSAQPRLVLSEIASRAGGHEMSAVPVELRAVPPGCLLARLGIALTHVGVGRARATMTVSAVHLNQRGTLQGGAMVALADATAGWATEGAAGIEFATADLSCNLLCPVRIGTRLVAVAEPLHLGRSTVVQAVRVCRAVDEDEPEPRLLAHFSCTQLLLKSG